MIKCCLISTHLFLYLCGANLGSRFSCFSFPVVSDDFSMNAVMRLNQYRPGLEYRLTSQTGPVHEPVFTMAVDLNEKTYEATGPSKRAAKLNVATKARLLYFCHNQLIFICFSLS